MNGSLPGSIVYGIFQARVLEWVAISSSRGSSQPRDWTQVSHIVGICLYHLSHQGAVFSIADTLFSYILPHNWKLVKCSCLIWEHISEGHRWRLLAWTFLDSNFSQYKESTKCPKKQTKKSEPLLWIFKSLLETQITDKFSTK